MFYFTKKNKLENMFHPLLFYFFVYLLYLYIMDLFLKLKVIFFFIDFNIMLYQQYLNISGLKKIMWWYNNIESTSDGA